MSEKVEQKPSIGRIVHYVGNDSKHRPAMVLAVLSDTCVNLKVFSENGDTVVTSVVQEGIDVRRASPFESWHWPEIEN